MHEGRSLCVTCQEKVSVCVSMCVFVVEGVCEMSVHVCVCARVRLGVCMCVRLCDTMMVEKIV